MLSQHLNKCIEVLILPFDNKHVDNTSQISWTVTLEKSLEKNNSVGLYEHFEIAARQMLDQIRRFLLDQRFTAGYFDQRAMIGPDCLHKLSDSMLAAFIVGILRIAIRTSQVATGEPDKHARSPGKAGFALDAIKDLVNDQSHLLFPIKGAGARCLAYFDFRDAGLF
jgi:hypothetical protein